LYTTNIVSNYIRIPPTLYCAVGVHFVSSPVRRVEFLPSVVRAHLASIEPTPVPALLRDFVQDPLVVELDLGGLPHHIRGAQPAGPPPWCGSRGIWLDSLAPRVGEASVPTREFYQALGQQYGMTGVTMM
jgi:hypothetical protein